MEQQSIVYGYIMDAAGWDCVGDGKARLRSNRQALLGLDEMEYGSLVYREMFSLPTPPVNPIDPPPVIHFGQSTLGIEYEWEHWIKEFEALLKQMYWEHATVHLETELSGKHTFTWEAGDLAHEPNTGGFSVRCEWSRESLVA
jgi:hypothetical protein